MEAYLDELDVEVADRSARDETVDPDVHCSLGDGRGEGDNKDDDERCYENHPSPGRERIDVQVSAGQSSTDI